MKKIVFNEEARKALGRGVDLITNSVKATLGPRGRNVVYGFHYGYPICTKDGVTVARQIEAKDQLEQLGVLLIREVAQKTADDTGDGTTTASVLAQAIFVEGLKSIASGANPILVKRGMDKAVEAVVNHITWQSKAIEGDDSIENVATLSANNDTAVGKIIKQAITKVGKDGVITIEDNVGSTTMTIDVVEGMQLNEGFLSPFFATDRESETCHYENPYILLADVQIDNPVMVKGIIDKAIGTEKRPLVIMCHGLGPIAMQILVSNRVQSGLPIVVCKASQFGEFRKQLLQDISVLTGASIVSSESGLRFEDLELKDLGTCKSFTANKNSTSIVGGGGETSNINTYIKKLGEELDATKDDYSKQKLQERYAKLTSGVAVIKVGGETEVEQKERKMRVEDALCATQAALDGGVIPGGGMCLFNSTKIAVFDSVTTNGSLEASIGASIIKHALEAPLRQIAANSGISAEEIIAEIKSQAQCPQPNYGYNFLTNKYGDLVEMGIIDPTNVVTCALKNAVSVAGMMLTTEVLIADEEEDVITKTPRPRSE